MTQRTTVKTLRLLVDWLNDMVEMPREAWRKEADSTLPAGHGMRAIPGVYILDCAYGGYRLAQIVGETGGERDITGRYGATITADLIRAYMAGIRAGWRHPERTTTDQAA